MQFGIFTVGDVTTDPTTGRAPTEGERIKAMVTIALKAEEVGLDVFATGEHHNPPFVPSSPTTMLGYIAARTERLVLSTSTALITTNDPVKIAEDFAMLQHLADGRVDLMMGRGSAGPVHPGSARTSETASRWQRRTTRCCAGCGARTTGKDSSVRRCRASRRRRARSLACRPSLGTGPFAAPKWPSRRRTTAMGSSTATSSGRWSTLRRWSTSTVCASSTTGMAGPPRPSSGSAGRSSCARTRRTPSPSSVPTSTTRRSTATGPRSRTSPLKTVLEQLDLLGEQVVPVLRREFAALRPTHVPVAPTHASLKAAAMRSAVAAR